MTLYSSFVTQVRYITITLEQRACSGGPASSLTRTNPWNTTVPQLRPPSGTTLISLSPTTTLTLPGGGASNGSVGFTTATQTLSSRAVVSVVTLTATYPASGQTVPATALVTWISSDVLVSTTRTNGTGTQMSVPAWVCTGGLCNPDCIVPVWECEGQEGIGTNGFPWPPVG